MGSTLMDRRILLKLIVAASLSGCQNRAAVKRDQHIVVVGAGIIGASIAYHLAKSNVSVTVIDKKGPATHASRGTFAWVNATWAKQPRHYHALNQDGLSGWKQLQQVLDLPIRWRGSLEWFNSDTRQERLIAQIEEQAEWGEKARMVGLSELGVLEPQVNFSGVKQAAFSENDGAVDPVIATQLLLRAAEDMGANVLYPCELTGVTVTNSKLNRLETSLGSIVADKLVLATGAAPGMAKRFAAIDVPQRSTPGIIVITAPMPRVLNRIIVAPGIHMHQRDDGRIVLGEQEGAPQNQAHTMRLAGRPNIFPESSIAAQHAARILSVASHFALELKKAVVEQVYIGWRPLPIDGHPVLGVSPSRPDIYLAIMHSGVSLAPIVGQLAAHELTENVSIDRLEAFRPDREYQRIQRY